MGTFRCICCNEKKDIKEQVKMKGKNVDIYICKDCKGTNEAKEELKKWEEYYED